MTQRDPSPGDENAHAQPDVVQEAIDATASAYTGDGDLDVEHELRLELSSRGIEPDGQWVAETAHRIRSGHRVVVGEPDGSVDAEGVATADPGTDRP
jgi:hypothetical protein